MSISERALQVIKNNLSEKTDINLEDKLQDLDINSITFIQIIVALESEFDFEFEDEKLLFTEFPAVKDMVDYVINRTDGEEQ
jgi:acyl carrier protein